MLMPKTPRQAGSVQSFNVSLKGNAGYAKRSLKSLDWVNFLMADVTTGIGPFVAIYLTAARHWDPAESA
jgi:hypothetical protein